MRDITSVPAFALTLILLVGVAPALAIDQKFCHAEKNPGLCDDLVNTETRTVVIPADEVLTVANLAIPLGKRIVGPGIINPLFAARNGLIVSHDKLVAYAPVPKQYQESNSLRAATVIEGVFFSLNAPCPKPPKDKVDPNSADVYSICAEIKKTYEGIETEKKAACKKDKNSEVCRQLGSVIGNRCMIRVKPGKMNETATEGEPFRKEASIVVLRNNEFLDRSLNRQAVCSGDRKPHQLLRDEQRYRQFVTDHSSDKRVIGLTISGNSFWGHSRHLVLDQVEHLSIQNNMFMRSGGSSIVMRTNVFQALVEGNQFLDIGNAAENSDSSDAIDTHWSGDQLIISNNIIRRVRVNGLDIKNASWDGGYPKVGATRPDTFGKYINFRNGRSGTRGVVVTGNNISEVRGHAINILGVSTPDSESTTHVPLGHPNHSIILAQNVLSHNNTACNLKAAIQVKGHAVRYLSILDNAITNNCGYGISVDAVNKINPVKSDVLGVERLHRIVGVRIDGNTVLNNGRWCSLESPPSPEFSLTGKRFDLIASFRSLVQTLKSKNPSADFNANQQDVEEIYESNLCQWMDAESKTARSFAMSVRGVFGVTVTNNTIGNDVNLYNRLLPQGIVRTYSDYLLHVDAPTHTTHANATTQGAAPLRITKLKDPKEFQRIKDNIFFCSSVGTSQPRPFANSISPFTGKVDSSNRNLPTVECPKKK